MDEYLVKLSNKLTLLVYSKNDSNTVNLYNTIKSFLELLVLSLLIVLSLQFTSTDLSLFSLVTTFICFIIINNTLFKIFIKLRILNGSDLDTAKYEYYSLCNGVIRSIKNMILSTLHVNYNEKLI